VLRARSLLRLRCAALVLALVSCASPPPPRGFSSQLQQSSWASSPSAAQPELGPIESRLLEVDYFFGLLVRAGVPPSALPEDRRSLSPDEAARLLTRVLEAEVPLKDFGPWRMAAHLLLEVASGSKTVTRPVLHERMRRFAELLVLRPDGYLVKATTGRAIQHIGPVRLEQSGLRAEGFEVGPFYLPRKQFLYPVDGSLSIHPDAVLAGVYAPDEGTLGPALEGAGLAVLDTVSGIVALVLHPRESLEGLARLPATVRLLVENFPQHYAHFQAVSHGERVRLISRLVTNMALVCGSAGAGTVRVASFGSKLGNLAVPVLSVSARGTLAVQRMALPAGHMVASVSAAPGSLFIVHMSSQSVRAAGSGGGGSGGGTSGGSWKPPPGGPGKWVQVKEHMLEHSRRYQQQVTGTPDGWAYVVEHAGELARFDGFPGVKLLEAKGPGYAKFLDENLVPLEFFEGFGEMLETARRQHRVAQGTPIQWIVAEKRVADYLRRVFADEGLQIEVVHISARP
jgi:hypothetical protein